MVGKNWFRVPWWFKVGSETSRFALPWFFHFDSKQKKCTTSQLPNLQLHNFTHLHSIWTFEKPSWQNFLFGVTIQVDFNHPGSPSLRLSPCHGMLLPRSPCQWFWRSNIQWISSHKLKPATPKATTIHPPTHPLPPLPLQRYASATPRPLCFFCWGFPGIKGVWREQISFSKMRAIPARFFLFNRCVPCGKCWLANFEISDFGAIFQQRYTYHQKKVTSKCDLKQLKKFADLFGLSWFCLDKRFCKKSPAN